MGFVLGLAWLVHVAGGQEFVDVNAVSREALWDAMLFGEAAMRPGSKNETGLALKYCSHCKENPSDVRECGAAQQTFLLLQYLSELRRFVNGRHGRDALRCVGPTSSTCDVDGVFQRKSCMRRVCSGHLTGHVTPSGSAHRRSAKFADAELERLRKSLASPLEPKLRVRSPASPEERVGLRLGGDARGRERDFKDGGTERPKRVSGRAVSLRGSRLS